MSTRFGWQVSEKIGKIERAWLRFGLRSDGVFYTFDTFLKEMF